MDDINLKQAAQLLARARQRRRKDEADADRNPTTGNICRSNEAKAFYNGVVEALDALGVRQEVEQTSV